MDHSESIAAANASTSLNATQDDLRLGTLLVKDGIIKSGQVTQILARAYKERITFGKAAVRSGLVSARELDQVIGKQFRHRLAQPGESRISMEVITAYRNDHRVVEEMRTLRSALMLQWLNTDQNAKSESSLAVTRHNRTLAVTSAHRRDGRSFVAANLATAFAQAGLRTLLIDADLRRPRLHRLFGLNNRAGFATVMAGREKDSFVYRLRDVPGLSIMTAGGIPPNPTELLAPRTIADLFERCSHRYQVVLVDTPSGDASSDAALIATQASGYITIGRAGKTDFELTKRLVQQYADMGANLIGSVLTNR